MGQGESEPSSELRIGAEIGVWRGVRKVGRKVRVRVMNELKGKTRDEIVIGRLKQR